MSSPAFLRLACLALAAGMLAACATAGEGNASRYEATCLAAGFAEGSPAFGACMDRLQRDAAYWARLQSSSGFGGP